MSVGVDVLTVYLSCYLLGSGVFVQSLYLGECNSALGMQSFEIPDSALTASSSHDEKTVGPQNASTYKFRPSQLTPLNGNVFYWHRYTVVPEEQTRNRAIRTELYGGAWCPKSAINKDSYEFLQVDLNRLMVITQVEVQGRFGNGKGKEYATHFLLQYQREDGGEWIHFRNKTDGEIFDGNSNTYIAELRTVSPPIIGKRIRFIPYSKYPRTVCMRIEVYGCPWMDGVVSYYVRQGDRRGAEVDLFDFSYDGMIEDNYLTQGLGQLTDGEYGDTNFRSDKVVHKIKGYEWVGWRNDSTENSGPVEIKFKFDRVRKFKSVTLHCNNYFSKDVKIFRRALLYFSIGGMYFLKEPIQYDFMPDNLVEYARNVTIPLANSVGQFIKLKLFFDDKWMMISEVIFDSAVADGKFHPEEPPIPTHAPVLASEESSISKAEDVEEIDILRPYGETGNGVSDSSEGIRKQRNAASTSTLDGDNISIIIGALSALFVILIIIVIIVIVRLKRRNNNNRQTLMPVIDSGLSVKLHNTNGTPNEKISNGNMYYSIATGDGKMDDKQFNETGAQNEYEEPYIGKERNLMATFIPVKNQSQKADFKRRSPVIANAEDTHVQYDALYAAADIINSQVPNIPSIQGVSGNSIYGVPNADLLLSMDNSVIEIPKRNLRCIEVLGVGQFGEVHLCEATGIQEYLEDHDVMNRRASSPVLVVVKILRTSADDRARAEFLREIRNMSGLKDPNIVRVLGVCTREEPNCMVVEYMHYGDLNQFLVDHLPETDVSASNDRKLGYGCQIYMASQIASGMKYLESLNMVHRDLATRNCLVGRHFAIKISDFGMSRSLYSADYYRIEGRAVLPIRWMAWESILLGKFTTKSDVWSFGMTLWEILTFSKVQPYEGMSDEQVIENSGHHYRNDNQQIYLPQPAICPKEIYDLMLECWNRHESERPSFREIHMFLLRKNMGYDPKLEILGRTSLDMVHS